MAGIRIKVDVQARNRIVKELAGQHVSATANAIYADALRLVRPGKTGQVKSHVEVKADVVNSRRVRYVVQATDNHSILEHQGARRHVIKPRRRGGMLRFYWEKIGQDVAFPKVNHPGMKGTRFLVKPLEKHARKRGYSITIVQGHIPVR